VIGGSAGVDTAFDLSGEAAGFSAGTAGLVSCEYETCEIKKMIALSAMNLRKTMKMKTRGKKPGVYLAEPTCNASDRQ